LPMAYRCGLLIAMEEKPVPADAFQRILDWPARAHAFRLELPEIPFASEPYQRGQSRLWACTLRERLNRRHGESGSPFSQ
jgi:hypothetical protein